MWAGTPPSRTTRILGNSATRNFKDTSWWSLQPLKDPGLPESGDAPQDWQENPIDRFVFAQLREHGLAPSPPAGKRTLIRRAAYDLTGLPPTPEEVAAFQADESDDAYDRLIDRLLASPHYGERWGRHWLDVVRFGESRGFERNQIIDNAWPFRDYVIRSFNEDKPFDRLVQEHLAGDVLGPGDPSVEVGTTFLVAGANFVSEYRIEVSTDGRHWQQVADSYDRRPISDAHRRKRLRDLEITDDEKCRIAQLDRELGRLTHEIAAVPQLPSWWVGEFRPIEKEYFVFVGGNPQRRGDSVRPASLSALDYVAVPYCLENDAPGSQRRLALARWIVSPDNPLTPRVLANRLWHYHFGTGIVDTPSDFGYMGGRPTHPDLLDWLARQILERDWRLKPIHRQIMLSQTYRQASGFRQDAAAADAGSRFLWRFPPRRLSAEELRDTMLAVAGQLNTSMGGPGFRLYRYIQDNVATYIPLDKHGPETYRRAIYHQNARAAFVDLMSEFDCPDNAFATPRRATTTTPLQALTLMNHSFTIDMADYLAKRLSREAGDDTMEQIQRAFALAFARSPVAEELATSRQLIGQHGLRAFCRAILNSTELIYVE